MEIQSQVACQWYISSQTEVLEITLDLVGWGLEQLQLQDQISFGVPVAVDLYLDGLCE